MICIRNGEELELKTHRRIQNVSILESKQFKPSKKNSMTRLKMIGITELILSNNKENILSYRLLNKVIINQLTPTLSKLIEETMY